MVKAHQMHNLLKQRGPHPLTGLYLQISSVYTSFNRWNIKLVLSIIVKLNINFFDLYPFILVSCSMEEIMALSEEGGGVLKIFQSM